MNKIVLSCSSVRSSFHGVACFTLPLSGSNKITAHYSDGTKLSAVVAPDLVRAVRRYHAYHMGGPGPEPAVPDTLALAEAIQQANKI